MVVRLMPHVPAAAMHTSAEALARPGRTAVFSTLCAPTRDGSADVPCHDSFRDRSESNLRLPPEPLPHAMHQHRSFRSSKRLPPIGPTRPNTRLSPGAGTEWAATSLRLSHRAACFRHAFTHTSCALDFLFQPWLAADRRGHVPPSTSATETILEHACEYSRPQHDPKVRLRVAISRRIRQPGFVSSGANPLP